MGTLQDFLDAEPIPYLSIQPEFSAQVTILAELPDFNYEVEHSAPEKWWRSARCTYADDGLCYACEQGLREWNQKVRVYIPVLHQGQFKSFSQGFGKNSVIFSLRDYYMEHGTLRDTQFIISRNGKGKRSKYTAYPVDNSEPVEYNGDVSLRKVLESVDYAKQANYYKK